MKKITILLMMLLTIVLLGNTTSTYAEDTINEKKVEEESVNTNEERPELDYNSILLTEENEKNAINAINSIILELEKKDTSIEAELNKRISHFESAVLETKSTDEKEYAIAMLDSLKSVRDDYITYTLDYPTYEDEDVKSITIVDPFLVYRAAISAAIAYFSLNNYDLAEELLVHARDNDELDSVYYPNEGSDVEYSTIYQDIVSGTVYSGSSSFPNSGTTNDKDLYNAIHSFRFTKSESSSVVVITDRYDFALGDYGWSIPGAAVNTLYIAQQLGLLVPYFVDITLETSNSTSNASDETIYVDSNYYANRYIERVLTLGKGESKEYKITFSTSRTRTLQTFGHRDTYIEIYDANGTRIAYDDDDGYKTNALKSYYFNANIEYTVKVRMYNSYKLGEVKFTIIPSNSYSTYESIYNREGLTWTLYGITSHSRASLYTFTPTSRKVLTFETDKRPNGDYQDMYLYLIDPRHTYPMKTDSLYPHVYNDDGGGNLQSKITKDMCQDIPYLLVLTTFGSSSQNVEYLFTVD